MNNQLWLQKYKYRSHGHGIMACEGGAALSLMMKCIDNISVNLYFPVIF